MPIPPLKVMKLRSAGLQSAIGATYGMVRNSGTQFHQGWDLEAPVGTPCYAIDDGYILDVKFHSQFGNCVNMQFPYRPQQTPVNAMAAFYAHLSSAAVTQGAVVKKGAIIGYTGVTGNASASAPHLHFEIRQISTASPGLGATGRVDPGTVLGYQCFQSKP